MKPFKFILGVTLLLALVGSQPMVSGDAQSTTNMAEENKAMQRSIDRKQDSTLQILNAVVNKKRATCPVSRPRIVYVKVKPDTVFVTDKGVRLGATCDTVYYIVKKKSLASRLLGRHHSDTLRLK